MNHAPVNGPSGPVDMRDIRTIRDELRVFAAEQREHNARVSRRLGIVDEREPTPPLSERWHRWLPSLVTTRVALVGLTVATILSIAGSVAALPVARAFWPVQTVPPHVHETARAEVPR